MKERKTIKRSQKLSTELICIQSLIYNFFICSTNDCTYHLTSLYIQLYILIEHLLFVRKPTEGDKHV